MAVNSTSSAWKKGPIYRSRDFFFRLQSLSDFSSELEVFWKRDIRENSFLSGILRCVYHWKGIQGGEED